MSFEVFMQVWCLQKSKLWWKKRKKGENSGHWFCCHFGTYFGALSLVHFIHNTYHFESREVRSPKLQTVSKSELKQKSYGHCKKTRPSWAGILHRAKPPPDTRVPFHTPQGKFRTVWIKVRKFSHRAKHLLAHECNFAHLKPIFAPCETRCENFAQCKIECEMRNKVRIPQSKVWKFRTMQFKVRKFLLVLDTIFKHLLELKLCIWYVVLKLGKSGIQCFKRCVI